MDQSTLYALLSLALFIGVTHTLLGPDHYIPFIAMSRAGQWSLPKTILITILCGIGHVGSSVVLGILGILLGLAVSSLETFESFRGDIAGWLLLGFGIAYTAWGIRQAIRSKPHTHLHMPEGAGVEVHEHLHEGGHEHSHPGGGINVSQLTTWSLFTIFVLGPCEPLIPQLMYPAAKGHWAGVAAVALVFSIATIGTMTVMVVACFYGLKKVPSLERYTHAIAGIAIVMCGLAIKMGL